jgi:hypothetical protein
MQSALTPFLIPDKILSGVGRRRRKIKQKIN